MTTSDIIEGLKKVAPNIAISVGWDEDPNFEWDGDGPDPRDRGYIPHDVTVRATMISRGMLYEGNAYLGGVYEKSGQRDASIHGYFPQMAQEAVEELAKEVSGANRKQAKAASAHLKKVMRQIYESERARHSKRKR